MFVTFMVSGNPTPINPDLVGYVCADPMRPETDRCLIHMSDGENLKVIGPVEVILKRLGIESDFSSFVKAEKAKGESSVTHDRAAEKPVVDHGVQTMKLSEIGKVPVGRSAGK